MILFDVLIIVFIIIGGVFGWRKGFSMTASFVAGSFLGCWAGSNFFTIPSNMFDGLKSHPAAGYMIVFTVVFALVIAAGIIFHKFFKIVFMGWADRIAGIVVGAILSVSIIGGILVPLNLIKVRYVRKVIKGSLFGPVIVSATKKVVKVFPPRKAKIFDVNIEKKIKPVVEQIKKI